MLDMRTIFVGAAVAFLLLGIVQLLAWGTGRFGRWPAFWGGSNVLLGCGALAAAARGLTAEWIAVGLGNLLSLAGYGLLLAGVRIFAGRPARLREGALLLGAVFAVLTLAASAPADFALRVALVSAIFALLDMALMREAYGLWRRERLRSAWILLALCALTMGLFLLRAVWALAGGFDGADMFSSRPMAHGWFAVCSSSIVALRGMTLLLMAAERSQNRLEALAQRDPLTGALNRSGLRAAAEQMTVAGEAEVAVLLIDMDHFKRLNDSYGHAAGDAFLRLLTGTAQRTLRGCDVVARLGGDEFVALLPQASLQQGYEAGERLRLRFRDAAAPLDRDGIVPTLSIGVAHGRLGEGGQRLDALLKLADDALYDAKRGGRDQVAILVVQVVQVVANA